MGIVNPYFPQENCLKLSAVANANVFIETGTYKGATTKWASQHFKKVHTIELPEDLYNKTKDELVSKGNITPHLGDSRNILPQILKKENTNILFWLDGHYSGGRGDYVTAGKDSPCPLLEELDAILSRDNDDIIIIDDARMFTGKEDGYPSIVEMYGKIEENSICKRYLQICDDQIYIVPQKNEYLEILLNYVLERSVLLWNFYKKNIKTKIRDLSAKILKKLNMLKVYL